MKTPSPLTRRRRVRQPFNCDNLGSSSRAHYAGKRGHRVLMNQIICLTTWSSPSSTTMVTPIPKQKPPYRKAVFAENGRRAQPGIFRYFKMASSAGSISGTSASSIVGVRKIRGDGLMNNLARRAGPFHRRVLRFALSEGIQALLRIGHSMGHVLNKTEYGNVHHFRHARFLPRSYPPGPAGGDHDDAVNGQGLNAVKGTSPRSRRNRSTSRRARSARHSVC